MSKELIEDNYTDIGDGHSIEPAYFNDELAGIRYRHFNEEGKTCEGWLPITGNSWANGFGGSIMTWEIEVEEPLTLSPSVLCRICGDHGFIQNGKWVKAS